MSVGARAPAPTSSLRRRVLLMCPVVAFFEAAMFTFVYYWTPSLDSEAALGRAVTLGYTPLRMLLILPRASARQSGRP